jgi:DNA-binding transcriptional regulator YiaG
MRQEDFSPTIFKESREKLGLTQKELAEKLGVTLLTIHNWEHGRTKPNKSVLLALKYLEHSQVPIQEKCRLLREKLGLTKTAIANIFNIDLQTWSYWERGSQTPYPEYRRRIDLMLEDLERESLQKVS